MASYIALLQFTEQGIRNIKDTTKHSAATREMASTLGVKVVDIFWTLGPYDIQFSFTGIQLASGS